MIRSMFVRVVAVVVCLAFLGVLVGIAAEGTIVSMEKGKITVTVDGKNQEIPLKGVKVLDKEGKAIKGKEAKELIKAGVKVEITSEGDKVKEIKLK